MKKFNDRRLRKALSNRIATMIALAITFAISGFHANAGIPEKYGEKCTSSNGKECLRVKCYVKCDYVKSEGFTFPALTYLEYFSDNSVRWILNSWGDWIAEGVRTDDAGSFKVDAGSIIGQTFLHGNSTNESASICIYPMTQIEGRNILLPDKREMVFKVAHDNTFRMEYDGFPSKAIGGFGYCYRNYYYHYHDDNLHNIIGRYKKTTYPFGPNWQMFLNFILAPEGVTPGSVNEIFSDESETDSPIFDILGKRVERNSLSPGIYIYKGKKFLVK